MDHHHDPIDLSFIPRLLNTANGHLDAAATALKAEDRDRELAQAGRAACTALQQLYEHPRVWDGLRAQRRQHLQQWQTLRIPQTIAQVFGALGYHAQPPAEDLVDFGNDALQEAITTAIVDARETIGLLHDELKALTDSKRCSLSVSGLFVNGSQVVVAGSSLVAGVADRAGSRGASWGDDHDAGEGCRRLRRRRTSLGHRRGITSSGVGWSGRQGA
jgi:hypothetical protein